MGDWHTVRLAGAHLALRVHVGAGEGAVTGDNIHLVTGAGLWGRWFAIGDFTLTRADYADAYSLPKTPTSSGPRSFFTRVGFFTLPAGTVLNVGRASPLFGHTGGGAQGERLGGPAPRIHSFNGVWSAEYGHA